jgi:hypothetical protein
LRENEFPIARVFKGILTVACQQQAETVRICFVGSKETGYGKVEVATLQDAGFVAIMSLPHYISQVLEAHIWQLAGRPQESQPESEFSGQLDMDGLGRYAVSMSASATNPDARYVCLLRTVKFSDVPAGITSRASPQSAANQPFAPVDVLIAVFYRANKLCPGITVRHSLVLSALFGEAAERAPEPLNKLRDQGLGNALHVLTVGGSIASELGSNRLHLSARLKGALGQARYDRLTPELKERVDLLALQLVGVYGISRQ